MALQLQDIENRREIERLKLDKLELIKNVSRNVAHDLNNYLGIMISNVQMLQKQSLEENVKFKIDSIRVGIEQSYAITRDLLQYSSHDRVKLEPMKIGALLQEIIEFSLERSGVQYDVELEHYAVVQVDKNKIFQAISNLIINAVQVSTPGKDTIHIRSRQVARQFERKEKAPFVEIMIQDEGPGIPPEIQKRLFEPFFTTKEEGNGLGLANADVIIHAHQGRIEVDSEPGKGTAFLVYLPVDEVS